MNEVYQIHLDSPLGDLANILADPNCNLVDVIENEALPFYMKRERRSLVKYLKKETTIRGLVEIVLTEESLRDNSPSLISKALTIFTSNQPVIFQLFNSSALLADLLHKFLESPASWNSRLVGHFSRIVIPQIRFGVPILFSKYSDVIDLLMQRFYLIGVQEIILTVATRQQSSLFDNYPLVPKLIEMLSGNDEMAAASVLIDLYDQLDEKSPTFIAFRSPDVINAILGFCERHPNSVETVDFVDILSLLLELGVEFPRMSQHQLSRMTISPQNITQYSISAISLLSPSFNPVFDHVFCDKACPSLHGMLLQVITTIDPAELSKYLDSTSFLDDLIDTYGTDKWCRHFNILCISLVAEKLDCKATQTERWKQFVGEHIQPLISVLSDPFGGPTPTRTSTQFFHEEEDIDEAFLFE